MLWRQAVLRVNLVIYNAYDNKVRYNIKATVVWTKDPKEWDKYGVSLIVMSKHIFLFIRTRIEESVQKTHFWIPMNINE